MKLFALLGAMMLALIVPAHAADVVIPWGEWLAGSLAYFRDAIIGGVALAITWGARKLPGHLGDIIVAMRLEQLLKRAVDYGIAAVEGAAKDKVLTVEITNQVIAEAVTYAAKSAPVLAGKFADSLRAKILARLAAEGVVPAEASKEALQAKV